MQRKNKTPQYAIRLVVLIVSAGTLFFVGLQFFVPEGSKLTGSYDAESLLYIGSTPVSYRGSNSCGNTGCHENLNKRWAEGAHGVREEQSKCEVCHGPQGKHPEDGNTLPTVRGDGNLVKLCLSCHRMLKARSTTGQPQISPKQHPYPHEGELKCTQCHDPHSPGFSTANTKGKSDTPDNTSIATNCFSCHGPSGRGGFAPALAGQPYGKLKDKLTKYRSGEIPSPMMNPIVSDMNDKEIDALAQYFAGLS